MGWQALTGAGPVSDDMLLFIVFVDDVDDPYEVGSINLLVTVRVGILLIEVFWILAHQVVYDGRNVLRIYIVQSTSVMIWFSFETLTASGVAAFAR